VTAQAADGRHLTATDTPVPIIIGAACPYCRVRFTITTALASVPAPETGFVAARRHDRCVPPAPESAV
jgi:hypothetical protein